MKYIMTKAEFENLISVTKDVYSGYIPTDVFNDPSTMTYNFGGTTAKFNEDGSYTVEIDERLMLAGLKVIRRHGKMINSIIHLAESLYNTVKTLFVQFADDYVEEISNVIVTISKEQPETSEKDVCSEEDK